jgi:pilus assembly protein CpaD
MMISRDKNSGTDRAPRTVPIALALLMSAGALAGCQSTGTTDIELMRQDYTKHHPIMLSEEPHYLELPIGMKAGSLSSDIARAVYNHVTDYKKSGTGAMTVQVPSGSANEVAAVSAGREAARIMVRAGVPKSLIRMVPYKVHNDSKIAPVRLTFLKVKAVTPECGLWPEDSTATGDNSPYYNFGCAQQHNLAAMLANPADIVAPRAIEPASGARRAKVLSDYAKGAETKSGNALIGSEIGND